MNLAKYAKFIVAGVAAAAVTGQAAISDGTITADEWWKIAFTAAGAVFVLLVPNAPSPDLSRIEKVLPPESAGTTYRRSTDEPLSPRGPDRPLGGFRRDDDPLE
jgi:hypothetical protein